MRFSREVSEDVLAALSKTLAPTCRVSSAVAVCIERDESGWPVTRVLSIFTDREFDELMLLQLARDSIEEGIRQILEETSG